MVTNNTFGFETPSDENAYEEMFVRSTFNEQMVSFVKAMVVVRDGHIALDLPGISKCDMYGAIDVCKALMPDVERISAYVGGQLDIEYFRDGTQWTAR